MNGLSVLGLCLLVVAVASEGELKRLDEKTMDAVKAKFSKECQESTGVNSDVFQKALNGQMDTEDQKLKCYTKCMMQKFHVMKDNGEYDINILVNQMPLSRAKNFVEVIKKCNNEVDPDPCTIAMKVYSCTQKLQGPNFHFT